MINEPVPVPAGFVEQCAEKNACLTLNMGRPEKSKASVIRWRGRTWVCVGSVSFHLEYVEVDLCRCAPEDRYQGPPPDPSQRGHEYYTGGHFTANGIVWVMTDHEVTLTPSDEGEVKQLSLF